MINDKMQVKGWQSVKEYFLTYLKNIDLHPIAVGEDGRQGGWQNSNRSGRHQQSAARLVDNPIVEKL